MKRISLLALPLLTITLTTFCPDPIQAPKQQAAAPQKPLKIGYVDPFKAMSNLELAKDERIKIQQELERKANEIEELKNNLTKKANQRQSMARVSSPDALAALADEMKQLEITINVKQQSFQEHAERVSQEAQMNLLKEIELASKEYAEQNGIDIVLAGGIVYIKDTLDITDAIVEKMNKKYMQNKKGTDSKKIEAEKKS